MRYCLNFSGTRFLSLTENYNLQIPNGFRLKTDSRRLSQRTARMDMEFQCYACRN